MGWFCIRSISVILAKMKTCLAIYLLLCVYVVMNIMCWLVFGTITHTLARRSLTCLINVQSFLDALLFAAETGTTIGYGSRTLSDKCPSWYIIIWMLYIILIKILDCILLGFIAKKVLESVKRRDKFNPPLITVRDEELLDEQNV